jgi:hypothetical protein
VNQAEGKKNIKPMEIQNSKISKPKNQVPPPVNPPKEQKPPINKVENSKAEPIKNVPLADKIETNNTKNNPPIQKISLEGKAKLADSIVLEEKQKEEEKGAGC